MKTLRSIYMLNEILIRLKWRISWKFIVALMAECFQILQQFEITRSPESTSKVTCKCKNMIKKQIAKIVFHTWNLQILFIIWKTRNETWMSNIRRKSSFIFNYLCKRLIRWYLLQINFSETVMNIIFYIERS